MIRIQNLHKSYTSKVVLRDINLTISAGIVYGIVGRNGAGKTTLFDCISGLENYKGSIEFDPSKNDKRIGYLSTVPIILSRVTGEEFLRLFCQARNIPYADQDAFNVFGLPLNEYGSTYSTGMKKKLALTALLLQQNEIYILDEPFNGLDLESNLLLKEIILRLKSKQKTVLVSSHILSGLFEVCDELIYLKDGTATTFTDEADFTQIESDMTSYQSNEKLDNLCK